MSILDRKSIRFLSNPPVAVVVNGNLPAIVFSEAAKGCGLAMVRAHAPREDEEVTVTLANMAPIRGVIRWVKIVDSDLVKIGIEYLE